MRVVRDVEGVLLVGVGNDRQDWSEDFLLGHGGVGRDVREDGRPEVVTGDPRYRSTLGTNLAQWAAAADRVGSKARVR